MGHELTFLKGWIYIHLKHNNIHCLEENAYCTKQINVDNFQAVM